MTSSKGPSIVTEITRGTEGDFENLTREEIKAENERLKAENERLKAENEIMKAKHDIMKAEHEIMKAEHQTIKKTLEITLEYKRMVQTMLEDFEIKSDTAKYNQHYSKNNEKFLTIRKAFGDHLKKSIFNLDGSKLTNCFNAECNLPTCHVTRSEYGKAAPTYDEGPGSPPKGKKTTSFFQGMKPKLSNGTHSYTDPQPAVASSEEVLTLDLAQAEFVEPESSKSLEVGASNENDAVNDEDQVSNNDPPKAALIKAELSDTVEEETTNSGVNTDAPTAETSVDAEHVLPMDTDSENIATDVNLNNTDDSTASSLLECGPPPDKRLRSDDGSTEENSVEQSLAENETTAEMEFTEDNMADEETFGEDASSINEEEEYEDEEEYENSNVRTFNCRADDCDLTFESLSDAVNHYQTHSMIFKCSHCPNLYLDKPNLYRHLLIHNPPGVQNS